MRRSVLLEPSTFLSYEERIGKTYSEAVSVSEWPRKIFNRAILLSEAEGRKETKLTAAALPIDPNSHRKLLG